MEVRERRGAWRMFEWGEFPAMFEEGLAAGYFSGRAVLDVGTATGRAGEGQGPEEGAAAHDVGEGPKHRGGGAPYVGPSGG